MNIVGLITEYNPFHNGHEYHIREAKRVTNADYVIVVMSGNFVQRGAPAITDKYTRTKMALSAGADLVIEIPTCYATASAEFFASGSVRLLEGLGCVTHICFGSECGKISILQSIASLLLKEPEEYKNYLSSFVKSGMTFPLARKEAVISYLKHHTKDKHLIEDYEAILSSPNNILGIEYIKALMTSSSDIIPVTIKRIMNNYHDEEITHSISSASAIRKTFADGFPRRQLEATIPSDAFAIFADRYQQSLPIFEDDFSPLLYYKLLQSSEEELASYLDVNIEIAKRMKNLLPQFLSFRQFVELLKSKNLTQTRVQRMLLHILLGIRQDIFIDGVADSPNYIRILGMKKSASHLIRKSTANNSLPIITKVADAPSLLSLKQLALFQIDLDASHLFNQIVYQKFGTSLPDEYRYGVIFKN